MQLADAPFLDPLGPDFSLDSDVFRNARAINWFARTPFGYAVLRYEDCAALLKEPRLHQASSAMLALRGVHDGPIVTWWKQTMLSVDGADHTRLRRLVAKAFTPPMVERLRPYFRASAQRLVEAFDPSGRCEFVEEFCSPYPLEGICEMLGIPLDRRAAFSGWASDLALIFGSRIGEPAMRARAEASLAALQACADETLAACRNEPGDNLVSKLIAAEADGDHLTEDELRTMIVGLVFAGNDTTRNQLALGTIAFMHHPQQWELLRARPELAPRAVDEMMRLFPTIGGSPRIVAEEFTFKDHTFKKGSVVVLLTSAANVDDLVFGDAPFDISPERPAPNLTFSGGIHRCLGMWLAKAEMEEALRVLASRFERIASDGQAQWESGLAIRGPRTLPLHFTAA